MNRSLKRTDRMARIIQREDGKTKKIKRRIWTNECGDEFVRVYGWWLEIGLDLEPAGGNK